MKTIYPPIRILAQSGEVNISMSLQVNADCTPENVPLIELLDHVLENKNLRP